MTRTVGSRCPPETEADRYWRDKLAECPRCWRPLAVVAVAVALALLL